MISQFTLAVRVVTDTDIRIGRLQKRESESFGARIEAGGDMYVEHQEFIAWAGEYDTGGIDMRSKSKHDDWQKLLSCHQIVMDGSKDINENFAVIRREIELMEKLEKKCRRAERFM